MEKRCGSSSRLVRLLDELDVEVAGGGVLRGLEIVEAPPGSRWETSRTGMGFQYFPRRAVPLFWFRFAWEWVSLKKLLRFNATIAHRLEETEAISYLCRV